MSKLIILFSVLFIFSTTSIFVPNILSNLRPLNKEPNTVPYVDVAKYLGAWYEQSAIPFYFERDCTKTVAKYSLNADKTIRVDNSCYRNGKLH